MSQGIPSLPWSCCLSDWGIHWGQHPLPVCSCNRRPCRYILRPCASGYADGFHDIAFHGAITIRVERFANHEVRVPLFVALDTVLEELATGRTSRLGYPYLFAQRPSVDFTIIAHHSLNVAAITADIHNSVVYNVLTDFFVLYLDIHNIVYMAGTEVAVTLAGLSTWAAGAGGASGI